MVKYFKKKREETRTSINIKDIIKENKENKKALEKFKFDKINKK